MKFFNDGEDIFKEVFVEVEEVIKERSYLVINSKEVRIVKEVMACDVSPVAMFLD